MGYKIACSISLLFLGRLSAEDIRAKEISTYKVVFFVSLGFLFRMVTGNFNWYETGGCLLPGGFLLLLGFLTGESVGYGDGMTVIGLGLWTGGWFTGLTVWIGMTLSGIWAGFCLLKGKREPIPFIPFLLLGMEVVLIYA